MKFGWGGGRQVPRFNVRFQFLTLGDPIDVAIINHSTFIEITRTSQTSWVIEAPGDFAGDEALLFSTFKDKGPQGPPQDEGSYMMPFSLDVSCPSCP